MSRCDFRLFENNTPIMPTQTRAHDMSLVPMSPLPPANIVSRHSSEALLCFEQPPLDVTSTLAHGKLLPELLVSAGVTGVGPAEVICGSLPAEAINAVHIASTAIAFVFAHPNNKEGVNEPVAHDSFETLHIRSKHHTFPGWCLSLKEEPSSKHPKGAAVTTSTAPTCGKMLSLHTDLQKQHTIIHSRRRDS